MPRIRLWVTEVNGSEGLGAVGVLHEAKRKLSRLEIVSGVVNDD